MTGTADERRLNEVTEKVIGCAYTVANSLGSGFSEKVYENSLALVDGSVLVELKAAKAMDDIHLAQCLDHLKATGLKICLLINFGAPRKEVKRLVNRS